LVFLFFLFADPWALSSLCLLLGAAGLVAVEEEEEEEEEANRGDVAYNSRLRSAMLGYEGSMANDKTIS
jgi:hypothetical protein